LKSCTFKNNLAHSASKNIFIGFSKVEIDYGSFYEDPSLAQSMGAANTPKTLGSFVHLIIDVDLRINNTEFVNGYSQQGGAIYVSGSSSMLI
jgi:hypothetical protein